MVSEIARERNCTPAQLSLAWLLAKGDDIAVIPGTKRLRYLEEDEISHHPVIGARYTAEVMKEGNA